MLHRYNYIIPARIKVLVVPVSGVTQDQFESYYDKICRFNETRLLDITPMADLKFFNPQSFPNGKLLFEFSSSIPDSESMFLHDFEPFRKTFVVLGVGKFKAPGADVCDELYKEYPGTIVQNCIFFDTPRDELHRLNDAKDHSMKRCFYPDEEIITCLETVMCEVSRNFLHHLDAYAASYQNITLRSPVSITDSQLLSKTITKAQKRISSGSSSLKVQFNNSGGQVDSKNKNQVRNNGRHSKLLGSFYLLAGKYVDALHNFTDAMLYLRKTEDSMWLASALEGTGVSIMLLNFIEIPYQLPNAVLSTVLSLSKGKIRDMSIDSVARRISNESLSRVASGGANGANGPGANGRSSNDSKLNVPSVSPRTSSSFNFPSGPIGSGPDMSLIAIPELIKQLAVKVNYHFQVSTDDFENTVPDIVYIESLLRYINFMILVYSFGTDIQTQFFETVVKGNGTETETLQPTKTQSTTQSPQPDPKTHPKNPWFTKTDIITEIDKIFSLQLVDLNVVDQCRIYSGLASIYHKLGMVRKKAFILRVLVVGILPKLTSSITERTKERAVSVNNSQITDVVPSKAPADSSIKEIFKVLFADYGVNSEPEISIEDSASGSKHHWYTIHVHLIRVAVKMFEALDDKQTLVQVYCLALTRYLHCLPFDDQMRLKVKLDKLCHQAPELRIPYCDPFLVRSVQFVNTSPSKDELVPFTGNLKQEESSLFNPLNRQSSGGVGKSNKVGNLLISEETYQLRVTLQNPFSFEIEINDVEIVGDKEVETVNKGIRTVSDQTRILNGPIRSQSKLSVNNPKLRNGDHKISSPMSSNSEFFNTGNVNGHTSSNSNPGGSFIIGPGSKETLIVPFRPMESGKLVIEGIQISVGQYDAQVFPIVIDEKPHQSNKIKGFRNGINNPLDSIIKNLTDIPNLISGRVSIKTLELNVIDPQPSLSVVDISVTNSWLMLLEGEKRQFSVKLMNQSNQIINYMSFSFWDSTIHQLSSYLNNKASAVEVYELEWYLMKFKSFRIVNKQTINEQFKTIVPGQEITIEYEVTGKKNMTDSKMMLEYANRQDNRPSFLKTVEIPISVTVTPSIEIISFNIVPLFSSTINGFGVDSDLKSQNLEYLRAFMNQITSENASISDYCFIILDLRDSWTEELELNVDFEVMNKSEGEKRGNNTYSSNGDKSDKSSKFSIKDTLKPRKTVRYFIPIKRLSSTELNFEERIPSLRNKQYVKDYSISDLEDTQMKTAFWLRENILSRIKGTWSHNSKHGTINFRNFKLSNKMISCLIYPKVKILTEILSESNQKEKEQRDYPKGSEGSEAKDKGDQKITRNGINFNLEIEQFYIFRTKITNYSNSSVSGMLRHLPIPTGTKDFNVDKKILVDGLLQNKLPKAVEPNQTITIDLSFVILERGEYEWGLIMDGSNESDAFKISGREPVYIVAS